MQPDPQYADLDAKSDPQWGLLAMQPGARADIAWVTGGLTYMASKFNVVPGANWQKCRDTTGFEPRSIKTADITIGMTICVLTSGGRISIVKVVALPDDGNSYIDLYVTTYDPPVGPDTD